MALFGCLLKLLLDNIYLSSLCLYFIRTVPVLTSTIQIEFPPQVATLDVVFD